MKLVLALDHRRGLGTRETRTLGTGTLSIGRNPGNDWVLDDPDRHLSKTHCLVSGNDGRFVLTDVSTNGVFVNGAREPLGRDATVTLTDGDDFRLGDYIVSVTILPGEVAAPQSARGFTGPHGGAPDPLGGDLLDDPFAEPPPGRPAFPYPAALTPPPLRAADPFDLAEDNQRRPARPDDDIFAGRAPADPWSGPSQPDNVDAPFGVFMAPKPIPAASLSDDDFDALLGDFPPGSAPPAPPQQAAFPAQGFAGQHAPGQNFPAQNFPAQNLPGQPHPAQAPASYQPPQPHAAQVPPAPAPSHAPARPTPINETFQGRLLPADAFLGQPFLDQPFPGQAPPGAAIPGQAAAAPPFAASAPAAPPAAAPNGPVPQPAMPPPGQAAPSGAADAALAAFLEGCGVPELRTGGRDSEAMLRLAGALMRVMVEGMRDVLMSRSAIKNELRVEQTMLRARDNNPLKFSVTPEEALAALLLADRPGYKKPLDAAREAFDDIRGHEIAVMAGVQTALIGLLKRFDPEALEGRLQKGTLDSFLPGARKAKYWELFCTTYKDIAREAEDDFQSVFGREFAKAYAAQTKKL